MNVCGHRLEDPAGGSHQDFAPADYNGVIEGLLGGNLDMAWLGASGYAKVILTNPDVVEPVLVKINKDGSFGYYSIGFARVDSGIKALMI
jgi:phosphonate transport system substrate-binding protein